MVGDFVLEEYRTELRRPVCDHCISRREGTPPCEPHGVVAWRPMTAISSVGPSREGRAGPVRSRALAPGACYGRSARPWERPWRWRLA
jgi:hypothetical protein